MNKIALYIISVSLLLVSGVTVSVAQNVTETHRNSVERVKSLFEHEMFSTVKYEAGRILNECAGLSENERSDLASYMMKSDILMDSPNLDGLMREYEAEYRDAPEFMAVNLMYAAHYFKAKDYPKTLEILEKTEYSLLSKKDKNEYLFYRSFCQLRTGKVKDAETGFKNLVSGKHNPYTTSATYYLGYISYLNKDFRSALLNLEKVRDDDHFGVFCEYYILECKLMLEEYEYVIEHAKSVLEKVDKSSQPKVARMLSQAYYRTNRNQEAKQWFENYSSSSEEMSRKDNYFLGIVSYSLDDYTSAIESLNKVTFYEDSLCQNAYLHIANSYLKLRNKHEALKNYSAASKMGFDEKVREEAFFNYAKLSFDISSDISAFEDYLESYPKSKKSNEIYSYIATSYLLSKKYKSAINALNKITSLTPAMMVNLQKAAFLRAMELFERGSYKGAVTDFKISIRNSRYNSSLYMLAQFWLAETYFRMEQYNDAYRIETELYNTAAFKETAEYPLLLFNMGYNQFRMEKYPNAIGWFDRFLATYSTDMNMIMEAKLRVGDSFFMLKDYAKAASVYEEVSIVTFDNPSILYAAYQSAVCYGLISQPDKKIEILERIYNRRDSSTIYSKAVYELGRTYVREGRSVDAERCFKYLLDDIKDPLYNGKALLELGMLYANKGNYDQAVTCLTRIIEQMPMTEDAENAMAVLESIYITLNQPEEYLAYLDRIGMSSSKTADEKEQIVFNAAEQVFLNGNYAEARKSLQKYIDTYPKGQRIYQAYFYLGESLQQTGNKDAAAEAYYNVMDSGEGAFRELATLYYARINFELEHYDKAAVAYEELEEIARIENNRYEAKIGIMNSYFLSGKNLSAIDAAADVLAEGALTDTDRLAAEYVTAKSCLAVGRRDMALVLLEKLSEDKFSEYGAEAAYLLILDKYDEGLFEEVENLVYAFADSKSTQTYWLAKSFIVLGDSFAEREDWEQAEATFRSLLEEYAPETPKDDVHDQVKIRLDKLSKINQEHE